MNTGAIVAIVVVALVVVGGAVFFLMGNSSNAPSASQSNQQGNSAGPQTPQQAGSGTGARTLNVAIQGFAFSPASLSVHVGDTVVWTNNDAASHTVTSDSGNELGSSLFSQGRTYSHTFTTKGTFDYHCGIHTTMKGTVIVE